MELELPYDVVAVVGGPAVGTCRLLATPSLSLNHSLPPPLSLSLSLSLAG